MSKLDSIIDNKIAQNLFVWFCLFVILTGSTQGENSALVSLYVILFLAPAVYINNLYILPVIKRKRGFFFFLFFINAILFSTIAVTLINYFSNEQFNFKKFINFIGIMILAISFGTAIKLAKDSFTRRQQEKEAELRLLKGQLNPHFLFNTLNNLYGLSVMKSDKLPSLMLKLSDLLRYSLYETKETYVPLEKEIKYLENYMSLEKIRLEDKTEIRFDKTGNFSDKKIAPMLLIVFVENAFKYLEVSKDKLSKVKVNLKTEDNKLIFNCENTFDETEISKQNLETSKSGIGLQNAKKRLDLIYPNKHQLTIKKENENYVVQLILNF
jgi:LytS/YehU family sensor histidine kinase